MMNKKFTNPYIIYYPVVSRDSMPFPVNQTVQGIQEEVNKGRQLREEQLWRGNLVAAKFANDQFTQIMDASMADFPILKNFLGTHASPASGSAGGSAVSTQHATPMTTHSSPCSLPFARPRLPTSARFPSAIAQQIQFAEHAVAIPQAYDRDAFAHTHGMPTGMGMMPPPCRESKNIGSEYHHQHQHQHHLQPPMEL
jgi:hypothetical protein